MWLNLFLHGMVFEIVLNNEIQNLFFLKIDCIFNRKKYVCVHYWKKIKYKL
jgi:hypothetical protein